MLANPRVLAAPISCFDSRLAAYSLGPNCTILYVYIVSGSLPLGVLFGCVFLSQGLGYRWFESTSDTPPELSPTVATPDSRH